VYNTALVTKNPKLKDPGTMPGNVRLDRGKELQCTTCHDAHNNQYGNFLVMSNQNSELCNTCHTMAPKGSVTDIAAHNPCAGCHKTHTAPSGPYLLAAEKVSDTCLACHDGSTGPDKGVNITALARGANPHDTKSAVNLKDHIPLNVDCKDCHEPHTMIAGGTTLMTGAISATPAIAAAPAISRRLGDIDGTTIGGAAVAKAQFEYEVCLKCHGDKPAVNPRISRVLSQSSVRQQFATNAVAFHPVAVKGVNLDVPSLRPEYTTDSVIACTDCHGSDASKKAGGVGPNGPHGSAYQGILLARYETADRTAYSTTAYALCFRCHDNTKVVADSGPFPQHKKHIDDNQTPCSVCHDSHGIAFGQGNALQNYALLNFDTSVVLPVDAGHPIQFNHTGSEHGACTLKCHGKDHVNTAY